MASTRTKTLALVEGEHLLSEVGEDLLKQAQHDADTLWASPSDVDSYVDSVPDSWLECRGENRHKYPTLAETRGKPLEFIGRTDDGLLVREPIDCKRCGMAYRQDLYEIVGRGKKARLRKVAGVTKYHSKLGPEGQRYQAKPGHGRITSGMINESLATEATMGGGMTPAQIVKRADERAAEIAAAKKIAEAARQAERQADAAQHSAAS